MKLFHPDNGHLQKTDDWHCIYCWKAKCVLPEFRRCLLSPFLFNIEQEILATLHMDRKQKWEASGLKRKKIKLSLFTEIWFLEKSYLEKYGEDHKDSKQQITPKTISEFSKITEYIVTI